MRGAYYSDNDPFAAAWLRELIKAGHIAPGDVDDRSISEVLPDDLKGYAQCHFFAGIGVWSHALRAAGWPDDRPVWTGSCPCQPFSAAGQAAGTLDDRHLWPAFHRLVDAVRPVAVLGEQVSSALVIGRAGGKPKETDGPAWLDAVFADLEGSRYACGAVAFAAAGVGAPNIRERLYWVAQSNEGQRRPWRDGPVSASGPHAEPAGRGDADRLADAAGGGRWAEPGQFGGLRAAQRHEADRLADADDARPQGYGRQSGELDVPQGRQEPDGRTGAGGVAGGLEHPEGDGQQQRRPEPGWRGAAARRGDSGLADAQGLAGSDQPERAVADHEERAVVEFGVDAGATGRDGGGGDTEGSDASRRREALQHGHSVGRPGPPDGLWRDADWLFCRDGKWRPVEPGAFPLAHGVANRVGLLRGYGNAVNAQAAQAFVESVMEVIDATEI